MGEEYRITNHVFNNIFSDDQNLIEIYTAELQTGRNVIIAFTPLTILKLYLSPDYFFVNIQVEYKIVPHSFFTF